MSRIGKTPIPVPSGVEITISGRHVAVKGPKGSLQRDIPGVITIRQDDGTLVVERPDDERENRAMHGLVRSLVNNMVEGVTKGFTKTLEAMDLLQVIVTHDTNGAVIDTDKPVDQLGAIAEKDAIFM